MKPTTSSPYSGRRRSFRAICGRPGRRRRSASARAATKRPPRSSGRRAAGRSRAIAATQKTRGRWSCGCAIEALSVSRPSHVASVASRSTPGRSSASAARPGSRRSGRGRSPGRAAPRHRGGTPEAQDDGISRGRCRRASTSIRANAPRTPVRRRAVAHGAGPSRAVSADGRRTSDMTALAGGLVSEPPGSGRDSSRTSAKSPGTGDLRAVQPRSRYPSDHHRPKEPSRSPTMSHPH